MRQFVFTIINFRLNNLH